MARDPSYAHLRGSRTLASSSSDDIRRLARHRHTSCTTCEYSVLPTRTSVPNQAQFKVICSSPTTAHALPHENPTTTKPPFHSRRNVCSQLKPQPHNTTQQGRPSVSPAPRLLGTRKRGSTRVHKPGTASELEQPHVPKEGSLRLMCNGARCLITRVCGFLLTSFFFLPRFLFLSWAPDEGDGPIIHLFNFFKKEIELRLPLLYKTAAAKAWVGGILCRRIPPHTLSIVFNQ